MLPACSSGALTNVLPNRNAMPQTQDMPSIPSQYTNMGPTCCVINRCGTSHWNTQLPILMSWVRPNQEILSRPSTRTSERSALWCCYGGSRKLGFVYVLVIQWGREASPQILPKWSIAGVSFGETSIVGWITGLNHSNKGIDLQSVTSPLCRYCIFIVKIFVIVFYVHSLQSTAFWMEIW